MKLNGKEIVGWAAVRRSCNESGAGVMCLDPITNNAEFEVERGEILYFTFDTLNVAAEYVAHYNGEPMAPLVDWATKMYR